MTTLNFSTFMPLLQESFSYEISNEDLSRDLLESITESKLHEFLTKNYLGYIWRGERNVTKGIIESTEIPIYKKECYKWFEFCLNHDVSEHMLDDFIDKVCTLIKSDPTITQTKKDSLLKLCVPENYPKFLTNVFLYAIKKPNKANVTKLGLYDIDLLQEVNQTCPLCSTPLSETKTGKTIYRYSVSKIYPEFLSKELDGEFSKIVKEKPSEFDDKSNLICLCDDCASNYLFNPDIVTFDKLYRYKWSTNRHSCIKKEYDKQYLDDEICHILQNIKDCDVKTDLFKGFRLKPLPVERKIDPNNQVLKNAIKSNNDVYYFYIKEYLSTMDGYKASFRKIATEIQSCFLLLNEKTNDQDEIYYALVDWIMNKQHLEEKYRTAATIVVSFFVQNCEVFDEITE